MSDKIVAHHQMWADLPPFPPGPQFMDDADVEAWNDIIYCRYLVDDIIAHPLFGAVEALDALDVAENRAAAWVPATDELLLDWPKDRAGALLAEWVAA